MEIADQVRNAARAVLGSGAATLDAALSDFIRPFVQPGFGVSSATVAGLDGTTTGTFPVVIHSLSTAPNVTPIAADAVAVVIRVVEALDAQKLREGYEAISRAKALRKTPLRTERGVPHTNRTLGIIFALRSPLPLDAIADEIQKLNETTSAEQWPDMIAVAETGAIQYAMQFPGEGFGDYLPPGEGALAAYTPPVYVVLTIRPTAADTLNKLLAYVLAHLAFFTPGAQLPRWDAILAGVTKTLIAVTGYQFNQAGELRPVPQEYYSDRYIAPLPLRVTGPGGKVLGKIQFLSWQDGGVILLSGELPLDGFLIFLPPVARSRAKAFRLSQHQISSALPISRDGFADLLGTFQRQSNMTVQPDERGFIVQKVADEGSSSPFMARLLIGPLRLREAVFPDPATRSGFDKAHDFVTSAFFTARAARGKIDMMWEGHATKVTSGEVARSQGPHIKVDESIERPLRQEVETFLNAAVRALKQGMQDVAAALGVDIGFLFKKSGAFEKGVASISQTDPALAEYLRQTRLSWSELLLDRRNAIEHEGWMLPAPMYARANGGIEVIEPLISDRPVRQFVGFTLDRLACFVEEVTTHCLQQRLSADVTVTEIAAADRNSDAPERFHLTAAIGGLPRWRIGYHTSSFEQS